MDATRPDPERPTIFGVPVQVQLAMPGEFVDVTSALRYEGGKVVLDTAEISVAIHESELRGYGA
jgi:hypothetical protein